LRRIRFAAGHPAEVVPEPDPAPSPGHLLVRTEAVGVSVGLARLLAAGERGELATPGGEFVGAVVALGSDVAGFAVGDRVGGVVFRDAFADLVVADPRLVGPVPAEVDAAVALALVRGGLLALSTLRAARFEPGESVLVTAAASGTGHLAVQVARALGAGRVVGSADKADFVRGCGADEVVTYTRPSWGDPVDVVLDGVGGDLVARGVAALAPFGRLVAFSAGGGIVDVAGLLGGAKSVIGFTVGTLNRTRPELVDRHRAELWDLLAADRLHPRHIDFPLERVTEAIELITTRANLGCVVLRTG